MDSSNVRETDFAGGPLVGIRVVGLFRIISGPYLTRVLAESWTKKRGFMDRRPGQEQGERVSRRKNPVLGEGVGAMRAVILVASAVLLGLSGCTAKDAGRALSPQPSDEWPAYSQSAHATRFSSLEQITPANVQQLEVAWIFHTGELEHVRGSRLAEEITFECTPLVVDEVLYLVTGSNRVFALDAKTGKEFWSYDPEIDQNGDYAETAARGLAFRKAGPNDRHAQSQLFLGTLDGRLIGLDAKTGKPLEHWGNAGVVNLHPFAMPKEPVAIDQTMAAMEAYRTGKGVLAKSPADFPSIEAYNTWAFGKLVVPQVTSPPLIVGDLIIVGTAIPDNFNVQNGLGITQAFSVHDGRPIWSWDPIPRDPKDPAYATWSRHDVGGGNAWPPLSADLERELVFVPTSSPSPDYYGGERVGRNDYANSLVALHAKTGEVAWSFQIVRHDLWDYDTPQQPVLFELERNGETIPAVAIGSKVGHIFVLDRRNGKSLFANENRAVAQSEIPGEQTWLTQLFPLELPTFGLRRVTPEDAWGRTPEELLAARKRIESLRWEGLFTPPSFQGSIQAPSNGGGMNWGGMAYDPQRRLLITPATRIAAIVSIEYPHSDKNEGSEEGERLAREVRRMLGTPYVMIRDYLWNRGNGSSEFFKRYGVVEIVPQTPPPWGTLSAIALDTGKLAWEVPLGNMMFSKKGEAGYGETLGSFNFGGPMVTASGLVFIAGTIDPYFRAYDVATGEKLWQFRLPAPGISSPMTYAIDGRQVVVIAAGGHGKLKTELSDALVAFHLPATH